MCCAQTPQTMPRGQSLSKSGPMERMSRWPFGVESWRKANVVRGPRGRRRRRRSSRTSQKSRAIGLALPLDPREYPHAPCAESEVIDDRYIPPRFEVSCGLTISGARTHVPRKDNTVADCVSRWASPAGKAWMDISSHGDAEEAEEANCIIELEKAMEEGDTKCFAVMAPKPQLSQQRDARSEF